MKTLEGQPAINYLDRIISTIPREDLSHADRPQGLLLLAILQIEREFLRLRLGEGQEIEFLVSDHGFPSLSQMLAHIDSAIKSHQPLIENRQKLAAEWLRAVINFSDQDVASQNQKIFSTQEASRLPLVDLLGKEFSRQQIVYLSGIAQTHQSNSPEQALFTDEKYPGLLLTQATTTPFFNGDTEIWQKYKQARYYWKYVDAANFNSNFTFGTKDQPLDSDYANLPKAPRCPVTVSGRLKFGPEDYSVGTAFSPQVRKYYYHYGKPQGGKPKDNDFIDIKPVSHPIASQIEFLDKLKKPLIAAFLETDLTAVDDQTVDAIINSLPSINQKTYHIDSAAQQIANYSHHLTQQSLGKDYEELKEILRSIDNLPVRQKFQLACAAILNPTRQELLDKSQPKPPETKSSPQPKRPGVKFWSRS